MRNIEVKPWPTLRIVDKAQSDALARRQEKAAKALGIKWVLHPAHAVQRKEKAA